MKCFSLIITTLLMASVTFSRTNEYIVLSKDNDYLGSLEVVSELKEKTEEVMVESQIKVKKLITIVKFLQIEKESHFFEGRNRNR
ncbi:MAG: hypothetical protein HUJ25_04645 [Crocinitomicaceae bacterium]|nr:hypothetical protein [Crocinitomicaceae bacterium]